jgi:hypothetical protein
MAIQTNLFNRLSELGVVIRTVDVVTVKTRYSASVHDTLYEIIALHSVLMGRAICEVSKTLLA